MQLGRTSNAVQAAASRSSHGLRRTKQAVLDAAADAQRGALAHMLVSIPQRHLVAADLCLHHHLADSMRQIRWTVLQHELPYSCPCIGAWCNAGHPTLHF